MKKPSTHRAARQSRRDNANRKSNAATNLIQRVLRALLRWALHKTAIEVGTRRPARSNPMKHQARRDQFDLALEAVRKAFPDAGDDFHRAQAQKSARAVPIVKKPKPARMRPSVAAFPPPQERVRGFHGHKHGHEGMLRRPAANLSRKHPDYGLTPAEHAKRKALNGGQ